MFVGLLGFEWSYDLLNGLKLPTCADMIVSLLLEDLLGFNFALLKWVAVDRILLCWCFGVCWVTLLLGLSCFVHLFWVVPLQRVGCD